MKKYIGGNFILRANEDALYVDTNNARFIISEAFPMVELEAVGVCRRFSSWISVEDSKPKDSTRVLCYPDSYNDIRLCFYFRGDFCIEGSLYEERISRITHWMPLPEPPEVEE